jgi:preprotein translocase subunit SecE
MAFNETRQSKGLDWLKWLIIGVLFVAGLVANYYYTTQPWPLRLLGWLFLLAVIVGIASQTRQGQAAITFARESKMEMRKVVWPTRQETMQITLIVAVVVVVLALVLWGVDGVLVWLIGLLTGQRG